MPKITHTSLLYSDLSQLNEIPSEFLEPYLIKFMEYIIESVAGGWKTPEKARADLKGVEHFVSLFGGLHSRLSTHNVFYDFWQLSDESMITLCKETCK